MECVVCVCRSVFYINETNELALSPIIPEATYVNPILLRAAESDSIVGLPCLLVL